MTKIMLVEDDNNLREIYEARLAAEGFDIVSAQDGEAALAIAGKERPDLIISDVMMPKISGFEMLDILRNTQNLRDVKVIMLTALGQAEDSDRAASLGADKYLVKSQVTLEDIVKAAHDLLEGPAIASPVSDAGEVIAPAQEDAPAPAVQAAPAPAPVETVQSAPEPTPVIAVAAPAEPAVPPVAAEPEIQTTAQPVIPAVPPSAEPSAPPSFSLPDPVSDSPAADTVAQPDPAATAPVADDTSDDASLPVIDPPMPEGTDAGPSTDTPQEVQTEQTAGEAEPAADPSPAADINPDNTVPAEPTQPSQAPVDPAVVSQADPIGIAEEEAVMQARIDAFIQDQDNVSPAPVEPDEQSGLSDVPQPEATESDNETANSAPEMAAEQVSEAEAIQLPAPVEAQPDVTGQQPQPTIEVHTEPADQPEPKADLIAALGEASTEAAPVITAPQVIQPSSDAVEPSSSDQQAPASPTEEQQPAAEAPSEPAADIIQPTAPDEQPEAAPTADAAQPAEPSSQSNPISGKKIVIEPLNTEPKTDIHQLLELEEAKAAAQQAAVFNTPPSAPPAGYAGNPNATGSKPGFDPNSIAL